MLCLAIRNYNHRLMKFRTEFLRRTNITNLLYPTKNLPTKQLCLNVYIVKSHEILKKNSNASTKKIQNQTGRKMFSKDWQPTLRHT